MRLAFVGFGALSAASLMAAGITPQEYQQRRAELRKSLDGVMVLFGAEDSDDLHTSFFQESNFLYLSGWREPGAVMLLTQQTEILFLPPRDPRMELYTGRKLGPGRSGSAEADGIRPGDAEIGAGIGVPQGARDRAAGLYRSPAIHAARS